MSHLAGNYVKKLKVSPTGETITATERALLWYIADGHNEEVGTFHYATMKVLAAHCNVGERQVRRVVSAVESKGIVARIYQTRDNGSQKLNSYVFPALGYTCPVCGEVVDATVDHTCASSGKSERDDQKSRTKGKNTRKTPCVKPKKIGGKPLKASGKAESKSVEVTASPLSSTTGGGCRPRQGDPVTHDRGTLSPTTSLIPNSLTNPSTNLETKSASDDGGCGSDLLEKELPEKPAREMTLLEVRRANAAPPPAATADRGKWDAFKDELERQLQKLPEKLRENAMEAFDEIRDTTLIDEGCEGDTLEPTWTISASDPARTQAAILALRQNVKSALWKSTKGATVHIRVYGGEE